MATHSNWKLSLPPELELVLRGSLPKPGDATAARIRELLSAKLDWSRVASISFEHHVETFLYENLRSVGNDLVPAACLDQMRESARKAAGMAMLFSSELLRVQEIFDAQQVPLIPYKGPALGVLAYHSLTQRRFLDLDFFVPQKNIPAAAVLLASAGFQGKSIRPEELQGHAGRVPGQYSFFHKPTRTQLELHTERTLRYFPVPLQFEQMRPRLIPVDLCGRPVRTFSVEDTLLMLSVHGAKHFWERLVWILDIAQLLTVCQVNWGLLQEIAGKMECKRVVLLGLYLAHDFFDAPLPPDVLQIAAADREVPFLAGQVREKYAGVSDLSAGVRRRMLFRVRTRDRFDQGLRHALRLAVSPTESDRSLANLPGFLSPLYVFLRPWRLLKAYGGFTSKPPDTQASNFNPGQAASTDRVSPDEAAPAPAPAAKR